MAGRTPASRRRAAMSGSTPVWRQAAASAGEKSRADHRAACFGRKSCSSQPAASDGRTPTPAHLASLRSGTDVAAHSSADPLFGTGVEGDPSPNDVDRPTLVGPLLACAVDVEADRLEQPGNVGIVGDLDPVSGARRREPGRRPPSSGLRRQPSIDPSRRLLHLDPGSVGERDLLGRATRTQVRQHLARLDAARHQTGQLSGLGDVGVGVDPRCELFAGGEAAVDRVQDRGGVEPAPRLDEVGLGRQAAGFERRGERGVGRWTPRTSELGDLVGRERRVVPARRVRRRERAVTEHDRDDRIGQSRRNPACSVLSISVRHRAMIPVRGSQPPIRSLAPPAARPPNRPFADRFG